MLTEFVCKFAPLSKLKVFSLSALLALSLGAIPADKALAEEHDALAEESDALAEESDAESSSTESSDSGRQQLEEVIVQAERRDASLQKTPIAVTALTSKDLSDSDIVDIRSLNNTVPSLVIQGPTDQANIRIYIRGIGTTNGTEVADQSVGFYVDGVFAARAQGALALFYDLESVQVLRGPQGTLFGRNNSAGALLVRTKRPGDEVEGNFELLFGSYNRRRASAAMSIPLTDNWGLRIAGVLDIDDGWVEQLTTDPRVAAYPRLAARGAEPATNPYSLDSVNRYPNPNQKLNNRDVRSARLSSFADLSDNTSWFLSVESFVDKSSGGILLNPVLADAGTYEAYIDSPNSLDLRTTVLRSTMTVGLGDSAQFEWILGGARLDRSQVVDLDSGLLSRFQEHRTEWSNTNSASNEFKFSGSYREGVLDWTAGIYSFIERSGIRFDIDASSAWPEGGATFVQPERGAEAFAAYAQFTYRPIEDLGLTFGLRFTDDSKYDRRGRNYTPYPNGCGGFRLRENAVNASALNGGNDIDFAEDFFDNATGIQTRDRNGNRIEGTPEPDGIDDNTGRLLQVDAIDKTDPNSEEPGSDGLDDNTGEPFVLQCQAGTLNELETNTTELTWLFRVSYNLVRKSETLFYFSAGTGYQAGVIQDAGNSTNPETSLSFEIGTKSDFDGIRLNTTLFFTDYSDLIRSLIDPVRNNTVVTNASQAQIFGVEIESTFLFGRGGKLNLGMSYLNTSYTGEYFFGNTGIDDDLPRGLNPSLPIVTFTGVDGVDRQFYNLEGNILPYAPTFQMNLGFSWAIALNNGTLTPRLRLLFSTEYFFSDVNTQISAINNEIGGVDQGSLVPDNPFFTGNPEGQDAYFKADLGLEYSAFLGWSLDFFISNLTDVVVKANANCDVGTAAGCGARYEAPRQFGLRFSWAFN